MWRVLLGSALLLAGCLEIWHYDAEVWVDVPYPPDSAWSLSPVSVVVAGARQDSGRVLRMFPLLSREKPPEPQTHPVRLELWVDGEKRLELPDTARVHRLRLALPEGWHTLQVRAGTTASRIRHVRVLAPERFPLRFERWQGAPPLPRQILPGPTLDTALTLSDVSVHVFYDFAQNQWVMEHPRETLRIRKALGFHLWALSEGLYALVFREHTTQVYWVRPEKIAKIQPPAAYSSRFFMEGILECGRTLAMLHHRVERPQYLLRFVKGNHVQDTVLDYPSRTPWFLECRDGEIRVTKMSLAEYRKNFPSPFPTPPAFTLLHIEGEDSVFRNWADLWWKEEGEWYHLALPEAPLADIACRPGRERRSYPGTKQVFHLRCNVSTGLLGLNPRMIQYQNHGYTWSIRKEEQP